MQRLSALGKDQDLKKVESIDRNAEKLDIRIGAYYSSLKTNQKKRFNSIIGAISRKFGLLISKHPLEMLLVRQIALHTVRIEEAELNVATEKEPKYVAVIEKWLFSAYKERREVMVTLNTLQKIEPKRGQIDGFLNLRNSLRKDEGLEKTEEVISSPDGHDRRYYDDITRTTKKK